jgi:hypothetical protein
VEGLALGAVGVGFGDIVLYPNFEAELVCVLCGHAACSLQLLIRLIGLLDDYSN